MASAKVGLRLATISRAPRSAVDSITPSGPAATTARTAAVACWARASDWKAATDSVESWARTPGTGRPMSPCISTCARTSWTAADDIPLSWAATVATWLPGTLAPSRGNQTRTWIGPGIPDTVPGLAPDR